jgi:hypothetical protein
MPARAETRLGSAHPPLAAHPPCWNSRQSPALQAMRPERAPALPSFLRAVSLRKSPGPPARIRSGTASPTTSRLVLSRLAFVHRFFPRGFSLLRLRRRRPRACAKRPARRWKRYARRWASVSQVPCTKSSRAATSTLTTGVERTLAGGNPEGAGAAEGRPQSPMLLPFPAEGVAKLPQCVRFPRPPRLKPSRTS